LDRETFRDTARQALSPLLGGDFDPAAFNALVLA
jgi:hypothetical protein